MFAPNTTVRWLPNWRKCFYATAAVVLFFTALEVVLHCCGLRPLLATRDPFVGFESTIPLYVQRPGSGEHVLTTALNKRELFNAQEFPKDKPSGTFRIFCVGGSTTFGRPYDDTTSFPGWLRVLLPRADASRSWEVINAGGVSYASYRVVTVMEELARYHPDLFVVYSGHNEFLERRTYGKLMRMPVLARRASALFSRTRAFALLHSVMDTCYVARRGRTILPGEVDPVLNHVDGPTIYLRDDQLRDQIFAHFEVNIDRMVDIARSVGARILLITPASNVKDCSPFRSQHDDRLADADYQRWTRLFQRGQQSQADERLLDALTAFQEAAEIDPRFAEVHFRLGLVDLALDRLDDAIVSLERARDEDVCPLRAPSQLLHVVRQVAERRGVALLDFDSSLKRHSTGLHGHAAPGSEYFVDHVHLTIDANRMLALSVLDWMIQAGLMIPGPSWNESAIKEVSDRIENQIDSQTHAVALRNLARVLWWSGKRDEAGPLALQAVEQLPHDPDCLIVAAAYMRMKGQPRQSVQFFSRALAQRPFDADAHHFAGAEWFKLGEYEKARVHILEALKLRPDDAELHCRLGEISQALGEREAAIAHFTKALLISPGYREAVEGIKAARESSADG